LTTQSKLDDYAHICPLKGAVQTPVLMAELQILQDGAREFGVELSENQLALFGRFFEELCAWNRRMNLTGISETRAMIIRLLLEPLVALSYLPPYGTLLDVGSGAGTPGIPLKLARHSLEVHLLESRAKKVSFLKHVIRELGLSGIAASHGRAEKRPAQPGLLSHYDVVTARALAPLKKTVGLCYPYIREGGLLITYKGSRVNDEIQESAGSLEELHLSIDKVVPYNLPEIEGQRYLVIVRRGIN
jgi:16S rRNA (guanine527-N7)-methyltransferase